MSRFSDDVNRMVDKHEGITERPRNPHDPKPSKAAMELAVLLSLEGFDKRGDFDEDKAAQRIQSALADLLEKAERAAGQFYGAAYHDEAWHHRNANALTKALEPWKPCNGPKKAI